MKKSLLICSLFCAIFSFGQSDLQQNYLATYGKVWGFLKYFHPTPSTQDWDKQLLSDFDSVLTCKNNSDFNFIIQGLIEPCSSFEKEHRETPDSLKQKECIDWMNSRFLSDRNKEYLIELYQFKPKFDNKYIQTTTIGNPKISNELLYDSFQNDKSIHYLALTRYWNVINYFFPYRHITPTDWNTVYKKHIYSFLNIRNNDDYYLCIRKLAAEIKDGHGFLDASRFPKKEVRYLPFFCESVQEGVFVSLILKDSLNSLDLKFMDEIISIDGRTIDQQWESFSKVNSESNDYGLSKATDLLRITNKDSIFMTIKRNGQLISQTIYSLDEKKLIDHNKTEINNYLNPDNDIKPYEFLIDSISGKEYCYINMGKLTVSDVDFKFRRKLYKNDHLIIDLRYYPNETLGELGYTLIKEKQLIAKFTDPDFDYPGNFNWTESAYTGNGPKEFKGQIYILVDYNTVSQSEFTVMGLQLHPRTTVIGGQTAGADGNHSNVPLPFGINAYFSGIGVYYPDGTPTQQVGIKRDYKIVQDKNYVEIGKDKILEKALELIRE